MKMKAQAQRVTWQTCLYVNAYLLLLVDLVILDNTLYILLKVFLAGWHAESNYE
jgi:hypothetical protein